MAKRLGGLAIVLAFLAVSVVICGPAIDSWSAGTSFGHFAPYGANSLETQRDMLLRAGYDLSVLDEYSAYFGIKNTKKLLIADPASGCIYILDNGSVIWQKKDGKRICVTKS